MFTLVVKEDENNRYAGGTVQKISTSDPNEITMLCAAEMGWEPGQTGSCTVRMT